MPPFSFGQYRQFRSCALLLIAVLPVMRRDASSVSANPQMIQGKRRNNLQTRAVAEKVNGTSILTSNACERKERGALIWFFFLAAAVEPNGCGRRQEKVSRESIALQGSSLLTALPRKRPRGTGNTQTAYLE